MRLLVIMSIVFSLAATAEDWRSGLTELQQFRTYPFVDKAFTLNRQQQYVQAVAELEKALRFAPEHAPLVVLLLDFQLAIPDTAAALLTYQRLPSALKPDKLRRIVQTQLDSQLPLPFETISSLLPSVPAAERQQILLALSQHFIAEQQLQKAFELLAGQVEINSGLLLQRAELAQQLLLPQQVIKDTEAVPKEQLTERDWQRYSMALLSQKKYQQAAAIANQYSDSAWSAALYRQRVQMQLAESDWTGAEQSFLWLTERTTLTEAEQKQRYQAAINSSNISLASALIDKLTLDCQDKVGLYLQVGSTEDAKAAFSRCPIQPSPQWLVYAERWLSADALDAVSFNDSTLTKQKLAIVLQKRIAEKDYEAILQRKFAQPLRSEDYSLLVNSINALPDAALQLPYLLALYQDMPDTYLLDRLSYLYIELQQPERALRLLVQALPFSAAAIKQKTLPERLLNLLQQQPVTSLPKVLERLDDWSVFPETQAELWRLAGDCERARQLLNPVPGNVNGWKTLALCANDADPGSAIQYWQQAHQLQPDLIYLKHIAYQYQVLQQPSLALSQWQNIPFEQLLAGDVLTMAELALQQGQEQAASHYLQQVKSTTDAEMARQYAIQAAVYRQQNQTALMLINLQKAAERQPKQVGYQLEYAYALVATEPEKARDIMTKLHEEGYQFNATQAAQLAYLNQQLSELSQTRQWTAEALALYKTKQNLTNADLTTQFSLIRLEQQLASHWQFSGGSTFTSGAITGERLSTDDTTLSRHGFAVKAEYFVDPLQQDLSLYAVVASNGNDSPWQTWGQQFGVSYKPLDSINLWLSAGLQQYPLAQGEWHSILRLTADALNAEPLQAEWRPVEPGWWERKLYLDAVWWPETGNKLAQVRFDQGRVWKLTESTAQTIKWYGLLQYDHRLQKTSAGVLASGKQLAAGMGLQWRFWPGEVPVLLQRERLEVSLEWQYQLAGDLNRREHALLLQFYLFW
ncbi:NfrA family protein [Rheinheimera gaetbuli]